MNTLADPIRLWAFGLGLGMSNLIELQVEFIKVLVQSLTEFCPHIYEYVQRRDFPALEGMENFIINQISRCQWSFSILTTGLALVYY